MSNQKVRVLFVDNFDSFTYNLVDEFCKRNCDALVYRADTDLDTLIAQYEKFAPQLLVISPGPGDPARAGVTLQAIDYFHTRIPVFGVCLGHQAIIEYFGGQIGHAPQVMHGKDSLISHDGSGIFAGIENPCHVARYHSLCALNVPDCLEVTARCDDVVMAVKHKTGEIHGVQFHPESILTPSGGKIIVNMLAIAAGFKGYEN